MQKPNLPASTDKFTSSFLFVFLMGSLTALDPLSIDMYLPAFSGIAKSFNTGIEHLELSVSAFFIGMALGQLIYGPLADRFGRRSPLIGGMILYFIATLGCSLAPNIEVFIACRFLQALGGCAGMVITRAIVRDLFDQKRVADFFSSMALVMGIAPIIAPTVGGFVNAWFGWQAIFYLLAACNLVVGIAIFSFLPETNRQRFDQLQISQVARRYWGLLKDREFVSYLIPDAAVRAGMFAYIAGSPFVFIQIFKIPEDKFGWVFGINALGLMASSQLNRRLLKYFEPKRILLWSVNTAFVIAIAIFLAPKLSLNPIYTLVPLFLFLATLNFIGPNAIACALAKHGKQAGTASALYGCLQWALASSSAFFVSYFHNGTASAMTGVILGCGAISAVSFWMLASGRNPNGDLKTVSK